MIVATRGFCGDDTVLGDGAELGGSETPGRMVGEAAVVVVAGTVPTDAMTGARLGARFLPPVCPRALRALPEPPLVFLPEPPFGLAFLLDDLVLIVAARGRATSPRDRPEVSRRSEVLRCPRPRPLLPPPLSEGGKCGVRRMGSRDDDLSAVCPNDDVDVDVDNEDEDDTAAATVVEAAPGLEADRTATARAARWAQSASADANARSASSWPYPLDSAADDKSKSRSTRSRSSSPRSPSGSKPIAARGVSSPAAERSARSMSMTEAAAAQRATRASSPVVVPRRTRAREHRDISESSFRSRRTDVAATAVDAPLARDDWARSRGFASARASGASGGRRRPRW
jgi:hypothetical protein